MRTTIDVAGRIVVPKALRDAMGLTGGQEIDIVLADGRLEVEIAPTAVQIRKVRGQPVAERTADGGAPLSAATVRDVLEQIRR